MKKIYFPVFVFFACSYLFIVRYSYGQAGQWVWLHGSSAINSAPSFGTIGVPSPTNNPPSVYESCQWTDTSGNFWLFGGNPGGTYYAALWKYDVSTNEWTWMKGPSTTGYAGSYGTQGIPSPTNNPPSKSYGVTTWTDTLGNLWLFGGLSTGSNNDLWKYDIGTNEWTWMGGTTGVGVYGTQGVPDPANHPGARWECASAWTDSSNNLWLFGGYSTYNDLWRYNIATNEWTWMKGSNLTNQPAVYGFLGVENALNTPGARGSYSHWLDVNGNFWIFGGWNSGGSVYNDFWRYNTTTNNWTWMGGDTLSGDTGVYGTRCMAASSNIPGARFENRAVWTDQNGNFWMFGGTDDGSGQYTWNDLWMYCFKIGQWIWISGDTTSNPAGNWGTQGVWSATNKPSGRFGVVSWTGHNNHLYLFGGSTSPFVSAYNDLWEFAIDTSCGSCPSSTCTVKANFTSSDTSFCSESGKCINFYDHSLCNPTSWQWQFFGATPATSTQQNPTNICYYTPGTYPVILIVSNNSGTDTLNVYPMITFANLPPPPTITIIGGDTLISSNGSYYQWYLNGSAITGATDSFYVTHQGGTYSVQITDNLGCNSLSGGVLISVAGDINGVAGVEIYPNPANQSVVVDWQSSARGNIEITVVNVLGEKVYGVQSEIKTPKSEIRLDVSALTNGVYFLKIDSGEQTLNKKFVVLHK